MNYENEMLRGQVQKEVKKHNGRGYSDQASLRYLANQFPGVVFKNNAGLMDVSFEVDASDLDNEGEVTRIKIKGYQGEKFIGAVSTLRQGEMDDYLGTFEATEVSEDLGDISDWIEEKIDSKTYQDIQELPEVNIDEVNA